MDGFLGLYVEEDDLVHFQPGSTVYVAGEPLRVRAIRKADRGHHVAFAEVHDRSAAESIRNLDVTVPTRRELGEDEYWPEDLIGLKVRPGGGSVTDVAFGPSQARLIIDRDGTSFEVPFVAELVPTVDLAGGYVEVLEIEGLSPPGDR